MEKRFVSFLLASLCVFVLYSFLVQTFMPRQPNQVAEKAQGDQGAAPGEIAPPEPEKPVPNVPPEPDEPPAAGKQSARDVSPAPGDGSAPDKHTEPGEDQAKAPAVATRVPQQWFTFGSADPDSPYRMLVTATNRGAALVRVALNAPQYKEINDKTLYLSGSGYLGGLTLSDNPQRAGCRIEAVGAGTPAAKATPEQGSDAVGLHGPTYVRGDDGNIQLQTPGDLITALDGQPVDNVAAFQQRMAGTRPGQQLKITVQRGDAKSAQELTFSATLLHRPLEVLRPEPLKITKDSTRHPPSYLMSLIQVDDKRVSVGEDELLDLPSLKHDNWQATTIDGPEGPGVEFRRVLTDDDLKKIGQSGRLEIIKRYRLSKVPEPQHNNATYPAYHVTLELEIRNLGSKTKQVAYRLDGPTGLTMEGWWYSYKTHPTSFGGAGARDVVWSDDTRKLELFACNKIVKKFEKEPDSPNTDIFTSQPSPPMKYAGCDAQYFTAVLVRPADVTDHLSDYQFASAVARPVAGLDPINKSRCTDVSFQLTSQTKVIPAGQSFRQRFQIYLGPKHPVLLGEYGLRDLIVYGWFGVVSKLLLAILHFFHDYLLGNYGLAIVMLTVLVRGCMFPLSRKMALNARTMQELAPEMKKIAEKYAKDMEKRTQAQRELFQKHNYNPFGGCLLMFLQLPIFIGLYRGLAVDILLRQAPLIPGVSWCANLAGPDKLLYWGERLPQALSGPTGWLGPYLNILPLVTCVLFVVQQKMFTPPPTDDQQRMQQQVMQFMMLFMAVLFFKIASGLCIYFIASSMWGLAERMLLPKSKVGSDDKPGARPVRTSGGNGPARSASNAKRKKPRRR